MFKKKTKLPLRPEPPTIEQIVEDVEGSKLTDVVFSATLEGDKPDDVPDPMTESFASIDDTGLPSPSASSSSNQSDTQDTQGIYKKVLTYVTLVDSLENAPHELQQRSDRLEELRNELQNSIDDLKEKSQIALDKSLQS